MNNLIGAIWASAHSQHEYCLSNCTSSLNTMFSLYGCCTQRHNAEFVGGAVVDRAELDMADEDAEARTELSVIS